MNRKYNVAIFTWCNQWQVNYGQILQCYALYELCKEMGKNPIVVRYRPLKPWENISDIPFDAEDREKYEYQFKHKYCQKQDTTQVSKFMQFMHEKISVTNLCYSVEDIKKEIDGIDLWIVGSDQLWNYTMADNVFFLEFADRETKCISYATSGIFTENKENIEMLKKLGVALSRFNAISVREEMGRDILQRYTNKKIECVLDPTLTFGVEGWNKIEKGVAITDKYIVCFCLGLILPHKHILDEISKKYEIKKIVYVVMDSSRECFASSESFYGVEGLGPEEFISLIKNASVVCTDSFHGGAFSILFNKEVFFLNRAYSSRYGNNGDRLRNLANLLGMNNRFIKSKKDLLSVDTINYSVIEDRLNEYQSFSKSFLKGVLA